jgi:hypothetical protein
MVPPPEPADGLADEQEVVGVPAPPPDDDDEVTSIPVVEDSDNYSIQTAAMATEARIY